MQPKIPLTQARLKELLHYDPETGIFTWRVRLSNRTPAGAIAGSDSGRGYLRLTIDKRDYRAHRLAFLYMTGDFPPEDVDHINGVRDDNRWVNLRPATRSENLHNQAGPRRDNTSGFLGVCWHKQRQKWWAQITLNGRQHTLGFFDDPAVAHATYLKAKDELHPTHQRLRRNPNHVG
jgi:hypothetical protein